MSSETNTNTSRQGRPGLVSTDHDMFAYFAVVSVFIILGNGVTLAVMCKRKRKKPTDLLLGTLAVTDSVFSALVFPLLIVNGLTGRWAGGRPTCYLNAFASMCLLKFSMLIACVIAVDRFLAIDKPLLYRSKITPTRVKLAAVVGALYSLSVSAIPLVDMICMHAAACSWHLCFYHWAADPSHTLTSVFVVLNVVDTALATSAVLVCNIGVIVYFVKKRNMRKTQAMSMAPGEPVAQHPPARTSRFSWNQDLKYARLMAAISFYFLICFAPIQVLIVLYHYGRISLAPQTLVTCQLHIVSINLLLNPILHALIRKQYRKAYWFILRHPTILCGRSTNQQFEFDQREPSDVRRSANLRRVSLAVLAVSRFRTNRKIDTGQNNRTSTNIAVPRIHEVQGAGADSTDGRHPGRFLGSFRIAAGTAECSPGPAPAKQLQVPSVQIRRACGVSYFSEPESVPPSPSLPVPVLPNFIEERRGTPSASDVESDAWTVCSNLANDPRPSVPSIFSDSYPGEAVTQIDKAASLGSAPAQSSLRVISAGSHESVPAEEKGSSASDAFETGWSPEEYVKPAEEIDGILIKKSRRKKSRKRKMMGEST